MSIIQKHFTPAEVAQCDSLLGQLEALLQPKLQNLDEDENQKYGVIDEKQKPFVDKDRDYRNTQPPAGRQVRNSVLLWYNSSL